MSACPHNRSIASCQPVALTALPGRHAICKHRRVPAATQARG